ncbi:hypothetical protein [Acetivibrio sp. MSJd-27]|jgi:hypothetical protein|uniref:hypothetical protein n=1 Tax=Acetivibrio sp. MSJd-27 TaxID=2841523 RepID=UPI0015AA65B7|nr:hypothetical protein [Acetivibrio sp. MSJd-27]MBU5450928.1 hypothetical protein [Acetivibrio sp. MSJd-27]
MKAIISSADMGKTARFLSFFGYVPIKRKIIQQDDAVLLNLILPVSNCNYEKTVQKAKKFLNKHGIKDILFEKDIKKKYAQDFVMDYHLVDGHKVMISKLRESMLRVFKLYGFKKGKLRLALAGNHIDPELKEILKANQEYFQFLVFQGKETPEKQEIADEFYDEFGINTVFKEKLEDADCDMLLFTDGLLESYGKDVKFIFNISDRPLKAKIPVLNDYHLGLPADISKFNCRHVELCEMMEKEYPLKGFAWNN